MILVSVKAKILLGSVLGLEFWVRIRGGVSLRLRFRIGLVLVL